MGWGWGMGDGGGVWGVGVGVGVVVSCSLNFLSECLQVGKWVGMAGRWVWGRLYGARGRARCGWVGGWGGGGNCDCGGACVWVDWGRQVYWVGYVYG